ncbi:hypothetical protein Nepgr_031700 [Nepenthes gracilis]|uniref:Uncharacterized protein n=1 Tax=Nepenthes gracilis TaxID=150966 RepID=A0AAD3TI21_NEPGR|nr:hypothetical protein Nepgr_031700 [Nepenthes gracilis]
MDVLTKNKEPSVDREGLHDNPSPDEAASYQLRGYSLDPAGFDAQQTNPSNPECVGINVSACWQEEALFPPRCGEWTTSLPGPNAPDPSQTLGDPTHSPGLPPPPPPTRDPPPPSRPEGIKPWVGQAKPFQPSSYSHIRFIAFPLLEFLLATSSSRQDCIEFWDLEPFEIVVGERPEATGVHATIFHPRWEDPLLWV